MPERRRRRGARRRRRLLVAGGVLAGCVVLAVAWFGWTARHVYDDLSTARTEGRTLRDALAEGDVDRARRALRAFQEASDDAASATDSLPWSAAAWVPFVGDDTAALATVSDVLADVGRTGVAPLLDSAEQVTARAYSPTDGQFPIEQIAAVEEPATLGHAAFVDGVRRLAEHDPGDLVGPLATAYLDLTTQVSEAEEALATAERASRLMPTFLGGNGERNYLYVFQNNAESRSGGGLPGNVSLVRAVDGKVEIVEQSSGAAFGQRKSPVLPLSPDERALYGEGLGTYFLNANFNPDVPRAAELWGARWEEIYGGTVDGVFTIDPVTLSYLLEATGPVTVSGVELGAGNVVEVVESAVYLNQPDPALQDEFLNDVAKEVFDTFAAGAGDQIGVIRALVRGVDEGRVRIHSFDEDDQAVVAGTTIAGELAGTDPRRPQVGVYLNDGTGSKMSYYLDYEVDVAAVTCTRDRQRLLGRMRITSDTPSDVASAAPGGDRVRRRARRRGRARPAGRRHPRDGPPRRRDRRGDPRRRAPRAAGPRAPRRPPRAPRLAPAQPGGDPRPHLADEHRPRPGRRRRRLRHPRPPTADRVLDSPLRLLTPRSPLALVARTPAPPVVE